MWCRLVSLLEILQAARVAHPGADLIFASSNPEKPLSDMTLTKLLRDTGSAERATAHGFRSSFKVWSAEIARVPDEISEAVLAHAIPQKVRAAYLRTDFLGQRRELMARGPIICLTCPSTLGRNNPALRSVTPQQADIRSARSASIVRIASYAVASRETG